MTFKQWLVTADRHAEKVKFEIRTDSSFSVERIIEILNETKFPMTNFELEFIEEFERGY